MSETGEMLDPDSRSEEFESDDMGMYAVKSAGKRHFMANKIRKRNGKKPAYHTIKSKSSNHKVFRAMIRNELTSGMEVDDYIFPVRSRQRSDSWWDCRPHRPKVW